MERSPYVVYMNDIVVYTAIFGDYDTLFTPQTSPNCDFICFSDKKIKAKGWQVRVVTPAYEDSTRNARMYKVLPHRYLGSYDVSVWVDGNILIRGDIEKAIDRYLTEYNMAVCDHA